MEFTTTKEQTMNAETIQRIRREQAAHYQLCREANRLGIPTSLDDPRSPKTLVALKDAIAKA